VSLPTYDVVVPMAQLPSISCRQKPKTELHMTDVISFTWEWALEVCSDVAEHFLRHRTSGSPSNRGVVFKLTA
jgi:hypothetical protein